MQRMLATEVHGRLALARKEGVHAPRFRTGL